MEFTTRSSKKFFNQNRPEMTDDNSVFSNAQKCFFFINANNESVCLHDLFFKEFYSSSFLSQRIILLIVREI